MKKSSEQKTQRTSFVVRIVFYAIGKADLLINLLPNKSRKLSELAKSALLHILRSHVCDISLADEGKVPVVGCDSCDFDFFALFQRWISGEDCIACAVTGTHLQSLQVAGGSEDIQCIILCIQLCMCVCSDDTIYSQTICRLEVFHSCQRAAAEVTVSAGCTAVVAEHH